MARNAANAVLACSTRGPEAQKRFVCVAPKAGGARGAPTMVRNAANAVLACSIRGPEAEKGTCACCAESGRRQMRTNNGAQCGERSS
eukprot:12268113-Alexandrium_andersonii.AAC.1